MVTKTMRKRGPRGRNAKGFGSLMLLSMLMIATVQTMLVAGLTRSATGLLVAQRGTAIQQAFHLAEGGLDVALYKDGPLKAGITQDRINQLIGTTLIDNDPPLGDGTYRVTVSDDATPGDAVVVLTATGTKGGTDQTLRATVELPVAQAAPFDYALAVGTLDLSGNAHIGYDAGPGGQGAGRVRLYVQGTDTNLNLDGIGTVGSNEFWVDRIDFVNPVHQPLNDASGVNCQPGVCLCPDCYTASPPGGDIGIFPPSRVGEPVAPTYRTSGINPLPPVDVNLKTFYDEAIAECVAEKNVPLATCINPTNDAASGYHHILATTTIDGNVSGPLEGIIYVEAGVVLTLKNNVVIHGTIVHEGTSGAGGGSVFGEIKNASSGLTLTIDSFAQTDINHDGVMEPPFAPGMAIAGNPYVIWDSRQTCFGNYCNNIQSPPGIRGFVMASGHYSAGNHFQDESHIGGKGVIEGGVLGMGGDYYRDVKYPGQWITRMVADQRGPVVDVTDWNGQTTRITATQPLSYFLGGGEVQVDKAEVRFKPLEGHSPYFHSGGSNVDYPTIRAWTTN